MEVDLYGELLCEATRLGNRLFRNNIGMAKYTSESGHVYTVPYGVGGKGGADLIGWTIRATKVSIRDSIRTYTYPQNMAVFTAIEVKSPNELTRKKRNKKEREREEQQKKFLEAVRASGGIAGVVQSIADYHQLIGHKEP
jgi:hypothetical protein